MRIRNLRNAYVGLYINIYIIWVHHDPIPDGNPNLKFLRWFELVCGIVNTLKMKGSIKINNARRGLLRFTVTTIPAMENSCSRAADNSNPALYLENRSLTWAYELHWIQCFVPVSLQSLNFIMMKNFSLVILKNYLKMSNVSWDT